MQNFWERMRGTWATLAKPIFGRERGERCLLGVSHVSRGVSGVRQCPGRDSILSLPLIYCARHAPHGPTGVQAFCPLLWSLAPSCTPAAGGRANAQEMLKGFLFKLAPNTLQNDWTISFYSKSSLFPRPTLCSLSSQRPQIETDWSSLKTIIEADGWR